MECRESQINVLQKFCPLDKTQRQRETHRADSGGTGLPQKHPGERKDKKVTRMLPVFIMA